MRADRYLLVTTALLLFWAAGQSAAQTDATALTCGDFKAANGPGKDAIGRSVLLWTMNTQNSAAAGTLPSQFNNYSKQQVRQRIEQRCSGQPAGANIIARLQTSS